MRCEIDIIERAASPLVIGALMFKRRDAEGNPSAQCNPENSSKVLGSAV
jgi:hypothetical protein